jgi:hypothetical protein
LPPTPDPRSRGPLGATGRVVLIGATVAAAAVLTIVLTRLPPPATSGVGSGGSVSSSASAPTASPTPDVAAACPAGGFAWSTDPWTGAAGSRGTNILLRGVTSLGACRIDGAVSVEIRDADGERLIENSATTHQHVEAGDVLELGIAWSNWCGPDPAQPLSAVLQLPGDSTEVPLIPSDGEILVPPCNGEGQPTNLSVTDIQSSDRPFPDG